MVSFNTLKRSMGTLCSLCESVCLFLRLLRFTHCLQSPLLFGNGNLTTRSHGQDILLLERREFLQILYDQLPDRTPIRMGCTVKNVKHTIEGVAVELSDGTLETGDVLLGCDGVHSLVRSAMWDHASSTAAGLITVKEKTCEPDLVQSPCQFNFLAR